MQSMTVFRARCPSFWTAANTQLQLFCSCTFQVCVTYLNELFDDFLENRFETNDATVESLEDFETFFLRTLHVHNVDRVAARLQVLVSLKLGFGTLVRVDEVKYTACHTSFRVNPPGTSARLPSMAFSKKLCTRDSRALLRSFVFRFFCVTKFGGTASSECLGLPLNWQGRFSLFCLKGSSDCSVGCPFAISESQLTSYLSWFSVILCVSILSSDS